MTAKKAQLLYPLEMVPASMGLSELTCNTMGHSTGLLITLNTLS